MKRLLLLLAAAALPALVSSCGLFGNSDEQAIVGGGAIAGKDYVCGLQPSDNAREYFNRIADLQPIETVKRTDGGGSKSGVRFVNNGGILIPPGVTISFDNHGYCMDPNLPAPNDGDEYQLVPMEKMIPVDMQDTYRKLLTRSPRKIVNENQIHSGAEAEEYINTLRNEYSIQHIIWALRTAGVDAAYADNLTEQQKRILDSCSEYEGQFEVFHSKAKANNKFKLSLIDFLDSFGSISIGPIVYKPSDLLDPVGGAQKIGDHLNALIELGESLPSDHTGFNYGEIEPGIYTDIQGTGSLQYHARIANSTDQSFIFYPSDYIGQVGSPANSSGLFASADTSMRQRVTGGLPDSIGVLHDGIDRSNREDDSSVTFSAEDVDNKRLYEKYNDAKSAEKALKKLFEKKLNQSKKEDKEYVGVIFYDSVEKKYYVSKNLQKGGTFEASINVRVNDRYQPYAYGHTHGDATIEFPDGHTERFNQRIYDSGGYSGAKLHDGESFSQGDKQLVNSGQYKKGFLLTPTNEWREY